MSFGLQKHVEYRNKKILAAAVDRCCVRCEFNGVESYFRVSRAHYTGFRQHALGKGRSRKVDDNCAADLCQDCHDYFDREPEHKNIQMSEEFLFFCFMTQHKDLSEGLY